ncbi:MAG: RNA polymerase factor sigma-54 [Desulfobacterota bacterium]|nr:RNA polymerase factor sigma-54 [Thermodesulfobacteriota bacterium]MDW8001939.1 RNA polymerase factor sigma-54 [Deltaproteobacteria bacterium]
MLELKQEQKLAPILTQRLQQAIKLLQLSRMELMDVIEEELRENPVLEIKEKDEGETQEESVTKEEIVELLEKYSPSEGYEEYEEKEVPDYERILKKNQNLRDYLRWQVSVSDFSQVERQVAEWVIESIDDNGYLMTDPEEISKESGFSKELVTKVLEKIKKLDPPGVGAQSLKECILLQYYSKEKADPLFELVLKKYFELLKDGKLLEISKKTGIPLSKVKEMYNELKTFDPKPGRNFADENTIYVVPDVFVVRKDDGFDVVLNDEELPELRINKYYLQLYADDKVDPKTKKFIKNKIKQAEWFIKSLEQRRKTLYMVAKSIVRFQEEFLKKGIRYLKPLTLKDVAIDVGVHESTVSRITTNKYMSTPFGTYEMKFFFPQAIDSVASDSVMNLIKELIDKEDKKAPLTDDEITYILREKYGIKIARRTVVKYREALNIGSSRQRKEKM